MTPWAYELLLRELDRLSDPRRRVEFTHRQRHELTASIEPQWQNWAACAGADPETWFPVKGSSFPAAAARACAACPVRRSCLATALCWGEDGIWAGSTPGQRRDATRAIRGGQAITEVLTATLAQVDRPRRGHRTVWSGAKRQADAA